MPPHRPEGVRLVEATANQFVVGSDPDAGSSDPMWAATMDRLQTYMRDLERRYRLLTR
jgi:hypothetical protein